MFNIHEGNADERARVTQERLELLKRARENYFWATDERVPVPEIVADGKGPDDGWLRDAEDFARPMSCQPRHCPEHTPEPSEHGERNPNPGGNTATARDLEPHQYDTTLPCRNCDRPTAHHSYGFGYPAWHCNVCCTCDLCMERLMETTHPKQLDALGTAREQVARAREQLYEATASSEDALFCTCCGAMLHCSTCNGEGPGGYCAVCGQRENMKGDCPDCDGGKLQDA